MSKSKLRLVNRVALVSGASRGIGRSIARAYALEGARVTLVAKSASDLDSVAEEILSMKGVAKPFPGDVTRQQDVKRAVEFTLAEFGKIDILVNNAGIPGSAKELDAISDAEWDEVMSTNVKGYFFLAREVLPHMRRQRSGNILNISSGAGERHPQLARARSILYNTSKFAVEGFNYSLASRLQGTGVNVNALKPGPIKSAFWAGVSEEELENVRRTLGEIHEPEFVNGLAVYLAALAPGELTGASLDARQWNEPR